jgi:hypothetical protein
MPRRRGLSKKEAADFCGVAESTFGKYVHEGKYPPATLPGNRWDQKLLENWMDEKGGLSSRTNDSDDDDDKDNPWNV